MRITGLGSVKCSYTNPPRKVASGTSRSPSSLGKSRARTFRRSLPQALSERGGRLFCLIARVSSRCERNHLYERFLRGVEATEGLSGSDRVRGWELGAR